MARRKDRPGPLEPRSEAILRAIIEEYVSTAQPVGSVTLVAKYRLGVSPATVRNVMAELESAGYLGHSHTSAGRQPTDLGYRLYVESIADAVTLAPVERLMIRHQFGQVEFASEQWFRLAASTLAGATHAAGLATPAKPPPAASGGSTWLPTDRAPRASSSSWPGTRQAGPAQRGSSQERRRTGGDRHRPQPPPGRPLGGGG